MWIEHDGKGAPDLPPGTRVLTRRDFGETEDRHVAHSWEWWHGNGTAEESNWIWPNGAAVDYSIISYRVVPE